MLGDAASGCVEITLVRHGESEANRVGRWQGQGDSPLSERGRAQAAALAGRLDAARYELVLSSDLSRALETAAALGVRPERAPQFREIHVGGWEGLTAGEVLERFPDQIAALKRGEAVKIGGGESWAELDVRVDAALAALRARLPLGSSAIVFAHGGVIASALAGQLGLRGGDRRALGRVANTAVSTLRFCPEGVHLLRFNDAIHSGAPSAWAEERRARGAALIALFADGSSEGSLEAPLGAFYGPLDHLYAPESRRRRAESLASRLGASLRPLEALASSGAPSSLGALLSPLARRHPGERVGLVADRHEIGRLASAVLASPGPGSAVPESPALEAPALEAPAPESPARLRPPPHGTVAHLLVSETGRSLADYAIGGDRPLADGGGPDPARASQLLAAKRG